MRRPNKRPSAALVIDVRRTSERPSKKPHILSTWAKYLMLNNCDIMACISGFLDWSDIPAFVLTCKTWNKAVISRPWGTLSTVDLTGRISQLRSTSYIRFVKTLAVDLVELEETKQGHHIFSRPSIKHDKLIITRGAHRMFRNFIWMVENITSLDVRRSNIWLELPCLPKLRVLEVRLIHLQLMPLTYQFPELEELVLCNDPPVLYYSAKPFDEIKRSKIKKLTLLYHQFNSYDLERITPILAETNINIKVQSFDRVRPPVNHPRFEWNRRT